MIRGKLWLFLFGMAALSETWGNAAKPEQAATTSVSTQVSAAPGPVQVVLVSLTHLAQRVSALEAVSHAAPRHWTIQSTKSGARLGLDLDAGRDSNGDGFADLLIGAPRFSSPSALQSGFSVLLLGGAAGLQTESVWMTQTEHLKAYHGSTLTFCDFNGDHISDVFIGVPGWYDPARRNGKTLFFPASRNSLPNEPKWFLPQPDEPRYGVQELISAGDVNGDGCEDLLAGSRYFTKRWEGEGAAFLYLGNKTGGVVRSSWQAFGGSTNAQFTSSAAGVGDVNGDRYHDVIIGAHRMGANGVESGRVYLYLGSPSGLQNEPAWFVDGWVAHAHLGLAVAAAGDVNGDGLNDFVVGAPGRATDSIMPGAVYLYLGSKTKIDQKPAWQVADSKLNTGFGMSVTSGADFDGDGHTDLVIGSPHVTDTFSLEGKVFLFRGNGRDFKSKPDWTLTGGQNGSKIGTEVRAAGDINQDGFADFAVASNHCPPAGDAPSATGGAGRVDVFFGGTNGYRAGQVFPSDGINSRTIREPAMSLAEQVLPTTRQADVPFNGFLYAVPLMGIFGVGLSVFWVRRSRVQTARAERARIARDLHDDLGAQLSRLQHEASNTKPEATREAVLALDRAIWSVNPKNDTLENLISFIGQYGAEFFAESGIRFRFHAPMEVPDEQLSPERRKNVFLAVKEALNNVLKHSGASEVEIRIALEPGRLSIEVEDNGKGFLPQAIQNGGNGLGNMAERMKAVHGEFEIGRREEGGTRVSFKAKL